MGFGNIGQWSIGPVGGQGGNLGLGPGDRTTHPACSFGLDLEAVFSPDGRTWAYLDQTCLGIQFWDGAADRAIGGWLHGSTSSPAPSKWAMTTFTPDGRTLIAGRTDGAVEFWDVAGLRRIKTLQLHPSDQTIYSLDLSPDGRTLASSGVGMPTTRLGRAWGWIRHQATGQSSFGETQEAALTDLATGQTIARFPGCTFTGFSSDGRTIVTCELGETLSIRDTPRPDSPPGQ